MLKSSKLKITFVVITMLLLLTTTTAIELKANPAYLKIPVGSYNISTINVTTEIDTSTGLIGQNKLKFNVVRGNVKVVLEGPYIDKACTQKLDNSFKTVFGQSGEISWKGSAGSYYFIANVSTLPNASVGETFDISLAFSSVNVTYDLTLNHNVTGTVLGGEVVPEVLTFALVSIGAIVVGITLKRF